MFSLCYYPPLAELFLSGGKALFQGTGGQGVTFRLHTNPISKRTRLSGPGSF